MSKEEKKKIVQIDNLWVHVGAIELLKSISLTLREGEIITLIGKNGVGKSTLLRIIAGLNIFKQAEIKGKVTLDESVALVHQQYQNSLFPWFSAEKNIFLPHKMNKKGKNTEIEKENRAQILAKSFGFENRLDFSKYPYQLSGGQSQMVAIMRAFASNKNLVLLDEPFSALDIALQSNSAYSIRKFAKKNNITVVAILHDLDLAYILSDRCLLLKDGEITAEEQISNQQRNQLTMHNNQKRKWSSFSQLVHNEISD